MQHNYPYQNYETEPFKFIEHANPPGDDYNYGVVERFAVITPEIIPEIKENMYAISTFGRVFNIRTGREKSQFQDDNSYHQVTLQKENSNEKKCRVHRLVAGAFIPKTEEDIELGRDQVNHKNLDPTKNYVKNLEWVTNQENTIHGIENGAKKMIMLCKPIDNHWNDPTCTNDENNGMARISNDQVHRICQLLEEGELSYKEICKDIGLEGNANDRFIVSTIKRRVRHKAISSQYNF